MADRKPQDQDRYIVRFPDGMRDRLKEIAALNNRSLNAEIIHRLQETLEMDAYQPVENINPDPAWEGAEAAIDALSKLTDWATKNGVKIKIELGDDSTQD